MAKRLSEKEIKEIIKYFVSGKNIDEIAQQFKCTKLTISRNLKKNIGEKEFKEIINKNKEFEKSLKNKKQNIELVNKSNLLDHSLSENNSEYEKNQNEISNNENFSLTPFTEIIPLDCEIENSPQKDLTSIPIEDVNFPSLVYMIVDKKIELETKFLGDYPEWDFLSKDELSRKTIEIYDDLKTAKRFCNKDQKVLKVPNTDVFKIVSPILVSRGISRIVSSNKLIAL